MAFRITITDLQRKSINDKPVLEVKGLKDDGKEWKTLLFDNKYSADFIAAMEHAGIDGMVNVEMKKSEKVDKNGKNYWNVASVEVIDDGYGDEPQTKPAPAPKSPPVEGPKPEAEVSPTQAVIENNNWRPEALECAIDILRVGAAAQLLPKKMNGKLLAVSTVEIAKIFETYLQGKEGLVTSTAEALATLNGLNTVTPPQPTGLGGSQAIPDADIPF